MSTLHQITIGDRKDIFITNSYETGKKLSITLADVSQNEAFAGSVTDIELRSQAASIRMSYSDFITVTTKALTQDKYNDLHFMYSLENNCGNYVFKWKSVDSNETTITLGVMNMCKRDYGFVIKCSLMLLSDEQKNLHHKVLLLETDLKKTQREKSEAIHMLDEARKIKQSFENELYAKFVLVLNEKKRKIRELSEPTCSKNAKSARLHVKVSSNRLHPISDSSDEDSHLDDKYKPGPSKAKCNNSLLFEDEDEPELLVSPHKIRNRKATNAVTSRNAVPKTKMPTIFDSESEDELFLKL